MDLVWLQGKELHRVQPLITSASQGWGAQDSVCSHQRRSQMGNSGLLCIQMATGARRAACLQRKKLSGIFPHGYGYVWLHSAEVVWEEAQSGVFHLSLLPSAHFRQSQPSPALPTPPSLQFCPQSCWPLAQKKNNLPMWAMSWIIVNTDRHQTQQRITVTETFHSYWSSILQLSKVIAASGVGKRCSFRDAGSLQLPSALNLALLPPRYGLGEKVCWLGVFFLLQNLSGLRKFFPTLNLL